MADGLPELLVGSEGGLSDQRFEFREGHFDQVELGTVGGQEPCADIAHGLGRAVALLA